jgi:RNA polymerase sigma-70 factor, ECF subfamily
VHLDLDRFHAGDEALFTALINTYSPRLVPQLRRYADSNEDLHDLLQEVWLRAHEKRRSFDGRGSFIGWLLTVARTVGMTAIRKRSREPMTETLYDTATRDDRDLIDLRDLLREAVLALPARQREVVMLRLIEGHDTADTARLLGCAEGTVKATLHQATRKLREQLKEAKR